jgi:hypothetical protein
VLIMLIGLDQPWPVLMQLVCGKDCIETVISQFLLYKSILCKIS